MEGLPVTAPSTANRTHWTARFPGRPPTLGFIVCTPRIKLPGRHAKADDLRLVPTFGGQARVLLILYVTNSLRWSPCKTVSGTAASPNALQPAVSSRGEGRQQIRRYR